MAHDPTRPTIRRGYVEAGGGQVHYREAGSGSAAIGSPPALVCLHATAYSGRTFEPFMPLVATSRRVIAPDTPGYGESDRPATPPTIDGYAALLAEAVGRLEPGRPVDLFGYHTGATLACAMAVAEPRRVRRLVLVGVPFFEGAGRTEWERRLVHEHALGEDLSQFEARWNYFVTDRAPGVTLARGFANFVDELKAYPDESWSHKALFRHDARADLARVSQPVLIVNPATPLAEASREAARALPNATVIERPDLPNAVFDAAPEEVAGAVLRFLDAADAISQRSDLNLRGADPRRDVSRRADFKPSSSDDQFIHEASP